jgi:hypothetical protein
MTLFFQRMQAEWYLAFLGVFEFSWLGQSRTKGWAWPDIPKVEKTF